MEALEGAAERTEAESRGSAPVSFGFSKRKETKAPLSKTHETTQEEPDYVTSLEGNALQSVKPREEKKLLVIPLIKKNEWRKAATVACSTAGDAADLQTAAVQELLEDARRHGEAERKVDDASTTAAIPLLMENRVPDGFETDDKLDVSLRPEEPADADYEQVPVDGYGLAMLRGMGWKEGDGIGKNKRVTKTVEAVPRPKGMGLGADRSALLQDQHEKRGGGSKGRKPGDEPRAGDEEQPLTFKKGVHCVVERGPHKDLYGTIEGVDEDNCRCIVKLAIGGQSVSMSQYCLKLIRTVEFEKNSKYINKTKYEQYKEAESANQTESRDVDGEENGKVGANGAGSPMGSSGSLKRKHEHRASANSSTSISGHRSSNAVKQSHPATSKENSLWLQQLLRVRLVDKRYKGGAYYNTKVIVEDVLGIDCVLCRTDDGKVLDGIRQSMLETVVPRDESSLVMIVAGESKGQLAEVIKKDKAKCTATVQPIAHRECVVKVAYDDICEWTGDSGHLLDY